MTARLQFWFEFASPYSYLSAMRIEETANRSGVELDWRPFLLGAIFKKDLGSIDSPMTKNPKKADYMWMDVARQSHRYRLSPFKVPDPFPQNGLLPTRIACHLMGDSRLPEFARTVYSAHFQKGAGLTDATALTNILEQLGFDAKSVLEKAGSLTVKQKLRNLTDEADSLGVFGAPFFVTQNGEMFWGDDRLEQAVESALAKS
ncbi:2-hydroxychromene-2-carboxylate isomerase [Cohaesibacter celericrescens]|uniref:2-hydroxychromene-2-carboxylate isomerase n=1 Tax=Cohaesibacter celericrescens TaxID=2067669 RepID=UPI001AEC7B3B|nr:2-hydroxychromene-2-carboxylate isomerase [Cohaesibacter celericrescens]